MRKAPGFFVGAKMASRKLSDLTVAAEQSALAVLADAQQTGLEILFYCTHRPAEEQARLFRNGRTLKQIESKARQLDKTHHRPDLAQLLLDVGPQYGTRLVTWAGPGQSNHQYGSAIDGVPICGGKPVWGRSDGEDLALWTRYGQIAKAHGFQWAGDWIKHREFPHIQIRGFNWRDHIETFDFTTHPNSHQ